MPAPVTSSPVNWPVDRPRGPSGSIQGDVTYHPPQPAKPRPGKAPPAVMCGRPIHLTATAAVAPNAQAAVNSQALHVPGANPVLIDTIKVGYNIAQPGATIGYLAVDGANILASIMLNSDMITKDFVPIWNFGESTNLVNEQTVGVTLTSLTPHAAYLYCEYVWHLRSGLYLRSADQLAVAFQNLGQQPVVANCRVSFSGHELIGAKDPPTRTLPYVASYGSRIFSGAATQTDQSTELDLANVTNDDLRVYCVTGRVDNTQLTGTLTGARVDNQDANGAVTKDLGLSIQFQLLTGGGNVIVPYAAYYRTAFGSIRAIRLPFDLVLSPGDYVIADLINVGGVTNNYGQITLGIVGEREVAL